MSEKKELDMQLKKFKQTTTEQQWEKGQKCLCYSFGGQDQAEVFFHRPFSASRQPPIGIPTHVS